MIVGYGKRGRKRVLIIGLSNKSVRRIRAKGIRRFTSAQLTTITHGLSIPADLEIFIAIGGTEKSLLLNFDSDPDLPPTWGYTLIARP